jgi:hypothetical protein
MSISLIRPFALAGSAWGDADVGLTATFFGVAFTDGDSGGIGAGADEDAGPGGVTSQETNVHPATSDTVLRIPRALMILFRFDYLPKQ